MNCQNDHTRFMVYARIYEAIYGHLPPTTEISLRRIMNEVSYILKDRGRVLLVCLDDANYLLHEGELNDTLHSILRLYEEYPGVRSGVNLTVSNIETDFRRDLVEEFRTAGITASMLADFQDIRIDIYSGRDLAVD